MSISVPIVRAPRRWGGFARAIGVALLATVLIPAWAQTAAQPQPMLVERAQFVLSDARTPPDASAAWQPVQLPDDWRRLGGDQRVQGWYRIRFDVPVVPERPLAIYLRHMRSSRMELFVNGRLVGGAGDLHGPFAQATGFQILHSVPPALLHAGENVLHVQMYARTTMNPAPGLGRVSVGDMREVRRIAQRDGNITSGAYRSFFAAMLTAGMIALFLWFARRAERVMLGFAALCLSWGIAGGITQFLPETGVPPTLLRMVQQYSNLGLPAPAVILCLRTAGLRWPRAEAFLWTHLAFVVTFPLWWSAGAAEWGWTYLRVAGPLLPLAGALAVAIAAPRPLRWSHRFEIVALAAMAVLFSMDIARANGWVELDVHNLRAYHVPLLLVALGAVIFDRHVAALWRVERSKEELEQRVAENTREIEAYHARLLEARRTEVLANERQRILADMHDGVGASLLGLLRHVQSGTTDRAGLEQRVQEVLQEMRIAIDALEPRDGDLAAVLGSLRYRLDRLIGASGVTLVWRVEDLPEIAGLDPAAVFSIQRILLEAITNAVRHAGAATLTVSAQTDPGGGIEIVVEDDGAGFDPAGATAGRGLGNMHARAARLGGTLTLSAARGRGTRVSLLLPLSLAGEGADAPVAGPTAPIRVPA